MKLISMILLAATLVTACGKKSNDDDGHSVRNWSPVETEDGARADLYRLINDARQSAGVQNVRAVDMIASEAQYQAQNWSDRRVPTAHFGAGQRCMRINQGLGVRTAGGGACGEISARGPMNATEAMDMWLRSPGALRYLNDPRFNRVGVGVTTDRAMRSHWVVIFYQL